MQAVKVFAIKPDSLSLIPESTRPQRINTQVIFWLPRVLLCLYKIKLIKKKNLKLPQHSHGWDPTHRTKHPLPTAVLPSQEPVPCHETMPSVLGTLSWVMSTSSLNTAPFLIVWAFPHCLGSFCFISVTSTEAHTQNPSTQVVKERASQSSRPAEADSKTLSRQKATASPFLVTKMGVAGMLSLSLIISAWFF